MRALGGMSWRQLQAALRQLGAVPVRARGSHQVWLFADGETFVVVINHRGEPVPAGILVRFRRLRERRCEQADDEPAFGETGRGRPRSEDSSPSCFRRVHQPERLRPSLLVIRSATQQTSLQLQGAFDRATLESVSRAARAPDMLETSAAQPSLLERISRTL